MKVPQMALPDDICLHFNSQRKQMQEITSDRYCLELMHYLIAAYPGHESRLHCNTFIQRQDGECLGALMFYHFGMEHRDSFALYFLCTISTVIRT